MAKVIDWSQTSSCVLFRRAASLTSGCLGWLLCFTACSRWPRSGCSGNIWQHKMLYQSANTGMLVPSNHRILGWLHLSVQGVFRLTGEVPDEFRFFWKADSGSLPRNSGGLYRLNLPAQIETSPWFSLSWKWISANGSVSFKLAFWAWHIGRSEDSWKKTWGNTLIEVTACLPTFVNILIEVQSKHSGWWLAFWLSYFLGGRPIRMPAAVQRWFPQSVCTKV